MGMRRDLMIFRCPVIADSIEGFAGPLAGVLAGLDWAAENGASHLVTAAADTPFFPRNLVDGLVAAAKEQNRPIALATTLDPQNGAYAAPNFWSVARGFTWGFAQRPK